MQIDAIQVEPLQIDPPQVDGRLPVAGERAIRNDHPSKPSRMTGKVRTTAALRAVPRSAPPPEARIGLTATCDAAGGIVLGPTPAGSCGFRAPALHWPSAPPPVMTGDPIAALRPADQAPDSLALHR